MDNKRDNGKDERVHGTTQSEFNDQRMARGLGWFSIGLGLLEVTAPERLGQILGMEERAHLIRLYGFREIAAGIGLLSSPPAPGNLAPWMWARVGGDALDIGTLGSASTPDNPKKANVGVAFAMVAGITLLDVVLAQKLSLRQKRTA